MYMYLKNLLQTSGKRNILLYGDIGKNIFDEEFFEFNIYYMDLEQNATDEKYRIFSVDDLPEYHIDAVILLKQLIHRQDIFIALLTYCNEYNAEIYDAEGRKISTICNAAIRKQNASKEEIKAEILKSDNISFDIFDTLLMRNVLQPEDVFELIERRLFEKGIEIENFKEKRIKAQEAFGLSNPNIFDIYDKLQKDYNINKDIIDTCCDLEIAIENEVLIPRKEMLEIYNYCIDIGKNICLISDMYLPSSILQPLLNRKGINKFENLYVSCDYKKLKLDGLFEIYKKQTKGKRYLHIGDSRIHDGICAELSDIKYCIVSSGFKQAQKTKLSVCIQKANNLEERIMLALVIGRLFNSPFKMNNCEGKISIETEYEFGYCFCAALISQFVIWIYQQVNNNNNDNILFCSRDGYMIHKLYKMLLNLYKEENLSKGIYFYTSRKASVMGCINDEAHVNMVIDLAWDLAPSKMMKEFFGLMNSQILEYDKDKYEIVHQYVWKHRDAIFERANIAKTNYYKYMGNIGLQIGKKYAFMDFVSSGTCQKSLMKIVPFEIEGLYMGWNSDEDRNNYNIKALFTDKNSFFMKNYKVLETFMTSQEPSLNHFNDDGEPVFNEESRSAEEFDYIKQMQHACTDFFSTFIGLLDPRNSVIENQFTDSLFSVSATVDIVDSKCMLNNLTLIDDWKCVRNDVKYDGNEGIRNSCKS